MTAVMPASPVTVTLNGAIVASSVQPALVDGTVVAPASPFLDVLAARYALESGTLVIEGSGRRIVLHVGARNGTVDGAPGARGFTTVVAPSVRAGVVFVPLAAVARALGYEARFEPSAAPVLELDLPPPQPIGTALVQSPPPGPYETFAPRAVATPARPQPSVEPRPRRTPILERDPASAP